MWQKLNLQAFDGTVVFVFLLFWVSLGLGLIVLDFECVESVGE
jgi:hypothetical protein